jgi:hypothetical protein
MTNGTQVFDTPESIKKFQLAAIAKAIQLEILGLKRSRGSASAMARKMGYTGSRKVQVDAIRKDLGLPALPA